MASTLAVMAAMPLTSATQKRFPASGAAFNPLPVRPSKAASAVVASKTTGKFVVKASLREKAVTGLTATALTASMMMPEVAEAAVSPSLKNFLLSIGAGGIVLVVIIGAVVGVSNFDPVKRT
ncbi:hypothetical protein RHGRI_012951 [Rhododendron griersonianum]|uniref:Ultraviolet-B-repressible protein n=1 Tax=Rhododendron griersonianum TaxID=479676 RepID=A0AAV6K3X1_9ERIC|nr:hypothetical protein RHGRI_012951 [Rhododendron griersonianum]